MKDYLLTGYVMTGLRTQDVEVQFRAMTDEQARREVDDDYWHVRQRKLYELREIDCPQHKDDLKKQQAR